MSGIALSRSCSLLVFSIGLFVSRPRSKDLRHCRHPQQWEIALAITTGGISRNREKGCRGKPAVSVLARRNGQKRGLVIYFEHEIRMATDGVHIEIKYLSRKFERAKRGLATFFASPGPPNSHRNQEKGCLSPLCGFPPKARRSQTAFSWFQGEPQGS